MNMNKKWLLDLADSAEELAADLRAAAGLEDSLKDNQEKINQTLNPESVSVAHATEQAKAYAEAVNRPDPPTPTEDVADRVAKKLASVSTTPVESIPPKESDKIAMDLNHEVVKKMVEDEAKEDAAKQGIPEEVDVDEVEVVETGKSGGRPKSEELLAVERYANAGGDLSDVKKAAKVVHRQRPELDLKKLEQKVRDIRAARS